MRAAMFVGALRAVYRVTLLVIHLHGATSGSSAAFAGEHCEAQYSLPGEAPKGRFRLLGRGERDLPVATRYMLGRERDAAALLGAASFDVVHCFRLYAAPLAIALARRQRRPAPVLQIDIDDIESSTHARLAALHRMNREIEAAALEEREAEAFRSLERRLLPQSSRVYVCSEHDATRIRPLTQAEVSVVPNTVDVPTQALEPLTTHPFTFLFVGTLGYYPNEDAVMYFCREVLPKLRAMTKEAFVVRIAGRGMPETLKRLAGTPNLRLIGEVADIEQEYADADTVIVPVRAGGGTRIKVLEAFAYRRPLISTRTGIEGIDVTPEEDCLVAETPASFARQCVRLMEDRDLARRLANNAYKLVTERYSSEVARAAIIDSSPPPAHRVSAEDGPSRSPT